MNIKAMLLISAFTLAPAFADDMKKGDTVDTNKSTDTSTAKLEADDLKVVAHHNHLNMMEIDMGKLAQKNGSAKVKAYGAMLIKDHTAANKQLTALAKKKGIAKMPDAVPMTDIEKKEHDDAMAAMTKMKTLKGAAFDREFLPIVIADHDKEVARADVAIATVRDADLKTFVETVKPTLQRHADRARELAKNTAVSAK